MEGVGTEDSTVVTGDGSWVVCGHPPSPPPPPLQHHLGQGFLAAKLTAPFSPVHEGLYNIQTEQARCIFFKILSQMF